MNESSLLWGLLFGSIGLGYLIYGRRQKNIVPSLSGLSLMALPYFIEGISTLVIAGLVLIIVPFVVKI